MASVLMWEKPTKVISKEEWAENQADGAPPGTFVPNMSEADRMRWKAKLVGAKVGFPQVEIRHDSTVIIVSLRGYKYKHYDTRQTPKAIEEARTRTWYPDPTAPEGWPTVHVASAGPMQMTLAEATEMHAAIEEALARLHELDKESSK